MHALIVHNKTNNMHFKNFNFMATLSKRLSEEEIQKHSKSRRWAIQTYEGEN